MNNKQIKGNKNNNKSVCLGFVMLRNSYNYSHDCCSAAAAAANADDKKMRIWL
jgi:hypothetical protein